MEENETILDTSSEAKKIINDCSLSCWIEICVWRCAD